MANDVSVTNFPSEKSQYRVAYDLMKEISRYESAPEAHKAREYYMNLYSQCYKVVYNNKAYNEVMKPATAESFNMPFRV